MTAKTMIASTMLGALLAAGLSMAAAAQTKVSVGYTAVTDFSTLFVAKEQGIFAKHGLDVEPVFIAINSNIPAAIQSNSIQIGGPTPSVFLQAVDGGLDLVTVAGTGVTSPEAVKGVGVVARPEANIKTPQDFVGKKVGAPGIGAFLHVLFRQWLMEKGVDVKKVTFVEVSFPTMNDILKAGTVDAVVTADPFMARIVGSDTGTVVANYLADLPFDQPSIIYTSTRDWAAKNAKTVKAYQDAIKEAADFIKADEGKLKTRADIGKHIKLPPEVLASINISNPNPVVSTDQLNWWIKVMQGQDMLQGKLDAAKLIVK